MARAASAQCRGDLGRVLLGVAVGDGGLVLVPVREQRVVLAEHQLEPLVEQPEHVADVAAVLQRRPLARFRAGPGVAGLSSARCQAAAFAMIMPGTAATGKPWVSKPHSGQGRSSTQVQSLVSGVIVMPACYRRIGS